MFRIYHHLCINDNHRRGQFPPKTHYISEWTLTRFETMSNSSKNMRLVKSINSLREGFLNYYFPYACLLSLCWVPSHLTNDWSMFESCQRIFINGENLVKYDACFSSEPHHPGKFILPETLFVDKILIANLKLISSLINHHYHLQTIDIFFIATFKLIHWKSWSRKTFLNCYGQPWYRKICNNCQ